MRTSIVLPRQTHLKGDDCGNMMGNSISPEALWILSGRNKDEFDQISRVIAERLFIDKTRPSTQQIATWRASGVGSRGLLYYVYEKTGRLVTIQTAELLWRLYTHSPQPRRAQTIVDYIRKIPSTFRCQWCGDEKGPFHIDHMIPLAKGGLDLTTNLQILCKACNLKKGDSIDPRVIYIEFTD